ncbi:Formylglycine-generating enzyme, required for sulfatase activity, contains SUMF1/FGE domain [Singulisphaera sp. GP187]|uniref:SUMF1/EgtB/PvdO family nonheme iron enzyme n=1 Tax=Singulisphaera sp. GP187 TaxID=1882752 RepID=UPI00092A44EE|nr:SUMF1/EgtB/PvdO family nonheme iron enzyme [Singulisphaera sp. GP187]SIO20832.1 Formylglycine-generating enzyme, required for sulfatase activity, contains SUMF1/FGE domain [Singulisphaera sp. GP187]
MAEFEHPRPNRPDDSNADDEVYGLAGDDSVDPEEEHESLSPGLDDASEESPPGHGRSRGSGPSAPPPAPLPRLWKAAPDPEELKRSKRKEAASASTEKVKTKANETKPAPSGSTGRRPEGGGIERAGTVRKLSEKEPAAKSKPRERKASSDDSDVTKKALVEETPTFDTYEARQRVRILIGGTLLAVFVVAGFMTIRTYLPSLSGGDTPDTDIPVVDNPNPPQNPQALEQEANSLLERARETAKKGDAKLAISLLERVVAAYPNTNAAREAKEALGRPAKNLPLFIDRPVVVANPTAPKPAAPKPAPKVVDATAPTAPQGNSAEVAIIYPANPAEPARGGEANAPEKIAPPVGRPLPKGFHSRPGTQAHESGWALEIVGDRDGAPMVLVPGGEFLMGNDDGEAAERPAHRVFLSTYYIDQHEVSVRQFDLFEKEVGRRTDRVRALAREATIAPTSVDNPVVMVNAKEAKDFATWAGKRLPTEAQWEMAARGPDGRIYPWGNDPPEWAKSRKARQIEPIMSYADDISPFGAHDMAGNAWEWTKDWYDSRYYVLVKNQQLSDPTGPTIVPRTFQLAVKGGSKSWTVTKREGMKFDQRLPFLGFRCVLAVEGPGNAFEPPPKPAAPGGTTPGPNPTGDAPPPF